MKTVTIEGTHYGLRHATEKGPRLHPAWDIGDVENQGDIIIICIGALPKSAKPAKSRQVVDGETQGSRHIVEGGAVYEASSSEVIRLIKKAIGDRAAKVDLQEQYIGRVFEGPCVLTHPEHRHHAFPRSVNVVVVQRNQDAEEREAMVRD